MTGSDLVLLNKIILGVIANDVLVDDSWIFAIEDQEIVNAISPWPFEQSIHLINLNSDAMAENFIGIKKGDVSGDAKANIQSTSSELTAHDSCLLYTSPSPRDATLSRMPSSA